MAELFDIYDDQDNWMGTAPRREVHDRGLWHRTFHCWLARKDDEDGRALVLFQLRCADKDTNPDCFDITVAGHLAAGETVEDAAREMEEELGFHVPFTDLVPLGTVREEGEGAAGGVPYIDREVSHVFGCLTGRTPDTFRLQPEEVAGLYEADAEALIALMRGERAAVQAEGITLDAAGRPGPKHGREVTAAAFVPRDAGYYIRVFEALIEIAR